MDPDNELRELWRGRGVNSSVVRRRHVPVQPSTVMRVPEQHRRRALVHFWSGKPKTRDEFERTPTPHTSGGGNNRWNEKLGGWLNRRPRCAPTPQATWRSSDIDVSIMTTRTVDNSDALQ